MADIPRKKRMESEPFTIVQAMGTAFVSLRITRRANRYVRILSTRMRYEGCEDLPRCVVRLDAKHRPMTIELDDTELEVLNPRHLFSYPNS